MSTEVLDPQVVTIITTIASIVLGIIATKFKTQKNTATNALSITAKKAEQFGKIINKLIAANEDSKVTNEEFNGIVTAIKELVELPEPKPEQ